MPDDDWHCSPECADAATAWCCHRNIDGDPGTWVGCEFGAQCPQVKQVHTRCVGLTDVPGVYYDYAFMVYEHIRPSRQR